MTMKQRLQTIRSWLRIDPSGFEGAGRTLVSAGWLLLLFVFVATVWPIFTVERMLGVGALMLIGLAAALGALLLVRIIHTRTASFWWGVLLVTAILLLLVGAGDIAPQG